MWVKTKFNFEPVDNKIIRDDFVVAEGTALSYSFLDAENKDNPFGRGFFGPIFYIFKVHQNHPLHIIHSGSANTHIYPLNEIKKKHPRMPVEVYEDKMDYDLSVFMMLPFVGGSLGEAWKRYPIPEGFIPINGEKSEASLIYLDRGASLHQQDSLTVSHVMPSYVLRHLGDWMQDGRNIISHEKTFGQKLEGRVSVPLDVGKKIFGEITSNLESRYKTKLSFKRD